MREVFTGCKLRGVAAALPQQVVEVDSFIPTFGEAKVARFKQVVGVESIHVASPEQRSSDLALAAAQRLFNVQSISLEEIDVLLFITQTPDAVAPPTACRLQAALGLGEHLFALDINQGCAGFLSGLLTAAHFLQHPNVRNVLILGGDTLSRWVDPADATSAMLFGDAGFAAVVGRETSAQPWTFESASLPSEAIKIPHGGPFFMQGTEVFNFSISAIPQQIQRLLQGCEGFVPEYYLLHQANGFILQQIARMCRVGAEQVPCRMCHRGNTSVASLPLLMCDLAAEGFQGTKPVVLAAFGVGLTTLATALTLDFDGIVPTFLVD